MSDTIISGGSAVRSSSSGSAPRGTGITASSSETNAAARLRSEYRAGTASVAADKIAEVSAVSTAISPAESSPPQQGVATRIGNRVQETFKENRYIKQLGVVCLANGLDIMINYPCWIVSKRLAVGLGYPRTLSEYYRGGFVFFLAGVGTLYVEDGVNTALQNMKKSIDAKRSASKAAEKERLQEEQMQAAHAILAKQFVDVDSMNITEPKSEQTDRMSTEELYSLKGKLNRPSLQLTEEEVEETVKLVRKLAIGPRNNYHIPRAGFGRLQQAEAEDKAEEKIRALHKGKQKHIKEKQRQKSAKKEEERVHMEDLTNCTFDATYVPGVGDLKKESFRESFFWSPVDKIRAIYERTQERFSNLRQMDRDEAFEGFTNIALSNTGAAYLSGLAGGLIVASWVETFITKVHMESDKVNIKKENFQLVKEIGVTPSIRDEKLMGLPLSEEACELERAALEKQEKKKIMDKIRKELAPKRQSKLTQVKDEFQRVRSVAAEKIVKKLEKKERKPRTPRKKNGNLGTAEVSKTTATEPVGTLRITPAETVERSDKKNGVKKNGVAHGIRSAVNRGVQYAAKNAGSTVVNVGKTVVDGEGCMKKKTVKSVARGPAVPTAPVVSSALIDTSTSFLVESVNEEMNRALVNVDKTEAMKKQFEDTIQASRESGERPTRLTREISPVYKRAAWATLTQKRPPYGTGAVMMRESSYTVSLFFLIGYFDKMFEEKVCALPERYVPFTQILREKIAYYYTGGKSLRDCNAAASTHAHHDGGSTVVNLHTGASCGGENQATSEFISTSDLVQAVAASGSGNNEGSNLAGSNRVNSTGSHRSTKSGEDSSVVASGTMRTNGTKSAETPESGCASGDMLAVPITYALNPINVCLETSEKLADAPTPHEQVAKRGAAADEWYATNSVAQIHSAEGLISPASLATEQEHPLIMGNAIALVQKPLVRKLTNLATKPGALVRGSRNETYSTDADTTTGSATGSDSSTKSSSNTARSGSSSSSSNSSNSFSSSTGHSNDSPSGHVSGLVGLAPIQNVVMSADTLDLLHELGEEILLDHRHLHHSGKFCPVKPEAKDLSDEEYRANLKYGFAKNAFVVICSSFCFTALSTGPMVVASQQQAYGTPFIQTAKRIWRYEGFTGFFKGILPRWATLTGSILVVSNVINFFDDKEHEQQHSHHSETAKT